MQKKRVVKSTSTKQSFRQIVEDIRSLKIQGAQNVARTALISLKQVIVETRNKDLHSIKNNLARARHILFNTRPTEPAMRNAINYALYGIDSDNPISLVAKLNQRIEEALAFFDDAEKKIVDFGKHKIRDDMIVYTHCHSSTVTKILKAAKQDGKRFSVHNTETRPLFQGRITAQELAAEGIPVTHFVDSAARLALKKADIMLIGADAITVEGKVINKIGSELFASVAKEFNIPVYVCTNSWKFDPKTVFGFDEIIEQRHVSEVWQNSPKNVTISNFAFEQVAPDLISGVITELGIYKPELIVEEVEKKYPWMFLRDN